MTVSKRLDPIGRVAVVTGGTRGIGRAITEGPAATAASYVTGICLSVDGGWTAR